VSNRLSDDDVDRIARRVMGKIVAYAVVALLALMLAPVFFVGAASLVSAATRDIPGGTWLALPLLTVLIAGPVVLVIWLYGRSRRAE
jgi:hypothetical protein